MKTEYGGLKVMKVYPTLYSELAFQNFNNEKRLQVLELNSIMDQLVKKCGNKIFKNKDPHVKKIYLTFDDAPDQYCTVPILKILKKWNVKATFAVVGSHIDDNFELLKRIHDDGHYIINHTMDHADLTLLSNREIEKEVVGVEEKLEHFLGLRSRVIRPPYGSIDMRTCNCLIELGYQIVLWSYDTYDWLVKDKKEILTGFVDKIRNGEIVLLHSYENKENTVAALPEIISGLLERGFKFAMLDDE